MIPSHWGILQTQYSRAPFTGAHSRYRAEREHILSASLSRITRYPVAVSVTATPGWNAHGSPHGSGRSLQWRARQNSYCYGYRNRFSGNRLALNVTVTLTATGGTLSTSAVTTGTDGTAKQLHLTRGSTAGNENYVIASATNYAIW